MTVNNINNPSPTHHSSVYLIGRNLSKEVNECGKLLMVEGGGDAIDSASSVLWTMNVFDSSPDRVNWLAAHKGSTTDNGCVIFSPSRLWRVGGHVQFSFHVLFVLPCFFVIFSFFHLHLRRVYGHRSKTTPQPRMVCVTRRRVTFSLPTRPQCTSTRSSQFDTIQPCGRVFSASSRLQSKEYPVVWCECSITEEKLKEKKHIRSLCQPL